MKNKKIIFFACLFIAIIIIAIVIITGFDKKMISIIKQ